jgi:transcriptional regulator with XRE-family HTH domain
LVAFNSKYATTMKEIKNKYRDIPNSLRKYRKTSGYTQKQVAEVLGVRNSAMISRWENGSRLPSYLNVLRLAALYSTITDALYLDLSRTVREEMGERRSRLMPSALSLKNTQQYEQKQ